MFTLNRMVLVLGFLIRGFIHRFVAPTTCSFNYLSSTCMVVWVATLTVENWPESPPSVDNFEAGVAVGGPMERFSAVQAPRSLGGASRAVRGEGQVPVSVETEHRLE